MNCSIAIDDVLASRWQSLRPEYNIYELDKPFKVSSGLSLPKPTVMTISDWIEG